MPIVSAAGVLESLMLLVIQEPSGNFGPRIRKELFKAPNLVVRASKSGKMEKRHLADFYCDVYFPTAGDNTALLVDSWPVFADITLLDKANIEKKEMDFAMIPAGTTGMIQPFDVYGFRPWKCFFRHIEDHVALYDLPVVLH
ncbi:hypothetical protein BV898_19502 [Hypsibius exemplaris]|uniref:Uncharacterized protein n=1 Tax=Hypsibius exemplaris TaxID=2072580 RepID=A0A9X6RPI3_HYPEX|nr:hypothetical protein BV898_19502 [Hypsibius exemplaris]